MNPDAQARAGVYLLLAALLRRPPDETLLSRLEGIDWEASVGGNDLTTALLGLRQAVLKVKPAALEQEYHDLFIGVTQGELLPYGSWYLAGALHEKPLIQLRMDLRRLGLERSPETREPEDHIAAICEAAALLALEEHPEQRRFHRRHLAPWGRRFFVDLEKAESARFYRSVGLLGRVFMETEREYLDL